MKLLRSLASSHDATSLAVRLRRRRFELFRSLLEGVAKPAIILDVGGAERFWENMSPVSALSVFSGASAGVPDPEFRDRLDREDQ